MQRATRVERAPPALPDPWAQRAGQEQMGRTEVRAQKAPWDAMVHQVSTAMMVSLACLDVPASVVDLDPTGKILNLCWYLVFRMSFLKYVADSMPFF